MASIKTDGVLVEGEEVGVLDGFVFQPTTLADGEENRPFSQRRGVAFPMKLRPVCGPLASATLPSSLMRLAVSAGARPGWHGLPKVMASCPRPEVIDEDLLSIDQTQRLRGLKLCRWRAGVMFCLVVGAGISGCH